MDKKTIINNIAETPLYIKYRHVILYGLIGGFSAMLDFLVYAFLTSMFEINYLVSNTISVNVGILTSFFLNRQYNFKIKDRKKTRFFSFYIIGLGGLLFSSLLLKVLVEHMHMNEILSKLVTVFIVAGIQFLLNKFITFKK